MYGYVPLSLLKIDDASPVCLLKWLCGALIPQTYPTMINMADWQIFYEFTVPGSDAEVGGDVGKT